MVRIQDSSKIKFKVHYYYSIEVRNFETTLNCLKPVKKTKTFNVFTINQPKMEVTAIVVEFPYLCKSINYDVQSS